MVGELLALTSLSLALNVVPRMDAVWPDYEKKMKVRALARAARSARRAGRRLGRKKHACTAE